MSVLNDVMTQALSTTVPTSGVDDIQSWERFYLDHVGITADLSHILVPPYTQEFNSALILPRCLELRHIVKAIRKNAGFTLWLWSWSYEDTKLDEDRVSTLHISEREVTLLRGDPFMNIQIPFSGDMCTQSVLNNTLAELGGLTLKQTLVVALKHWVDHMELFGCYPQVAPEHPEKNYFLCNGSRFGSQGSIPAAYWNTTHGLPELCITSLRVTTDLWNNARLLETHP